MAMEALRKRAATLLSVDTSKLEIVGDDHAPNSSPTKEKSLIQEKSNEDHSPPETGRIDDSFQDGVTVRSEDDNTGFSRPKVRFLPPWVDDTHQDDEDEDDPNPSSRLLPEVPPTARAAQHNHTPSVSKSPGFLSRHRNETGRRHDARRADEPPIPKSHPKESGSRWKHFAQDSEYPRNQEEIRQSVNEEYLLEHGLDTPGPWNDKHQDLNFDAYRPKRFTAWERTQRIVLRSVLIPLVFRFLVFSFCLMALGMGGTIYKTTRGDYLATQPLNSICQINYEASTTSPLMAVIIDTVAIVYLFYITWDEYKGLPLGLRSGKAKILVLLFDLVFIVFSSVNVTLAFESIARFDPDCLELEGLQKLKWKQDFLASTLLIALVAWLMTFAVSVLRVVEKVEQ